MSKRGQESQGGSERYGGGDQPAEMADKPQQATAAQMARRNMPLESPRSPPESPPPAPRMPITNDPRIASARKPSGSNRSSRAGTPTAPNPFGQPQQQSMSFQAPTDSGNGFGGDFNFTTSSNANNPFANQNGASSTPPPTMFGNQTPQQNGGNGLFGNSNNSFGSTFGSGAPQQPQQNGFNTSSNIFGQNQNSDSNSNRQSTPSFGGFGQNQSQQNGLTPSTNNSFPSFGQTQSNGDNPFKGFGQSQSQPTQSTPNTSFGVSQPNGDKTLFGATPQTEPTPKQSTGSTFSSFGQQNLTNGSKPLFGATSQAEQTPKPATASLFGNMQNGGIDTDQTPKATTGSTFGNTESSGAGLFGSTAAKDPRLRPAPAKEGESVFAAWNESKKDAISPGMFTKGRDQTPTSNEGTNNLFGQQNGVQSSGNTQQTPKPTSTLFGGSSQAQVNGVKSDLFGSSSQAAQQTPKPTSNLFGATSQVDQQPPKPTSNLFGATPGSNLFGGSSGHQPQSPSSNTFGQQQGQDTSMTTPGNTPQKQSGSDAPEPTTSETPMGQGGSLFDRITPKDPPSTSFKPTSTPSTNNMFGQQPAVGAGSTSLFAQTDPRPDTPATTLKTSKPQTSMLRKPWEAEEVAPAAVPQPSQAAPAPKAATTASMNEVIPDRERGTLKVLNEGLRAHLMKEPVNTDWSSIMRYYMQQAANIRNKPEPTFAPVAAPAATPAAPARPATNPSTNLFAAQSSTSQPVAATKPPSTPSTSLFSQQQTPKPNAAQKSLLKPPQTAPVSKKRRADDEPGDEADRAPATEKRARQNEPTSYPKLPDNASQAAKLFEAALDTPERETQSNEKEMEKTNGAMSGFKPSTSGFTPSAATTGGFTPSATTTGTFTPATTSGGFKPSAPTSGMPTFSAPSSGSGGFLAAFGKKATAEEEKEKKKRKMEDYDSDEETEEAWLARDQKEQEAKRLKIMQAAKNGPIFVPSRSATPATVSEAGIGSGSDLDDDAGKDTETEKESGAGQGKSLFDRITPKDNEAAKPGRFSGMPTPDASKTTTGLFGSKTPSTPFGGSTTGSSLFSKPKQSIESAEEDDKTEAEKEQGAGDNTWKPNTPIKFGASTTAAESTTPAAPPPSFGNLFGSNPKSASDSSGHLSVPASKPFIGFNFGGQPGSSAGGSRASTPGVTTDGEGASTAGEEEEPTSQPEEPQVEDQTGLRPEEIEHEDVLFKVDMAKASKFEETKDESGGTAMGWVNKGKGPLYVLKHKETEKARLVLKVPPYGAAKMNFAPLKDINYEVVGKSGKQVQGVFIDHLNPMADANGKQKLTKWLIQFGQADDASELSRVLMEERA